ncbi:MAG: peptidase [Bdellovibrionales bacterium]|nr:peptidase [Bdellovibrionales bacterium]
MSKHSRQSSASADLAASKIIIDEEQGLVFGSEDELYNHFHREIRFLETEFFKLRKPARDISEGDFSSYEKNLSLTLEAPDEVWEDKKTISGKTLMVYIKEFSEPVKGSQKVKRGAVEKNDELLFHVAICYVTNNIPSFVYLHFPSRDIDLVEKYCRGELVYDRSLQNIPMGALEGDALSENDDLAKGLYEAMQKLRIDKDIRESEFVLFAHLRENTVEEADEIWRSADSTGNLLVNFIKEYPDEGGKSDLWYIVVTIEDGPSNSHALLFSFPTRDRSLVDRYRHGENLQAEEVVQESSH